MAAEDAVLTAALARQEVRQSLDRMEYHLGRGPRGQLGVDREVRFLDALSKQSARLGQNTAHGAQIAGGKTGLGTRAKAVLSRGNGAQIGRTKSSLLASFSDDTMLGARQWTYDSQLNPEWVWVANASACAACLANHGIRHRNAMTPEHPSCLCYPETVDRAKEKNVEALDDQTLLQVMRDSNNPRWRAQADLVDRGQLSVRDAIELNKRPGTARFYRNTLRQQAKEAPSPGPAAVLDDAARAIKGEAPVSTTPDPDDALTSVLEGLKKAISEDVNKPLDFMDTWEKNALTRIKLSAQKHNKLLRDAIDIMDDRIASTFPEFRATLQRIARKITKVETKAGSGSSKAAHFASRRIGVTFPDGAIVPREFLFNIRKVDDQARQAYNAAVQAHNAEFRRINKLREAAIREGNFEDVERLTRELRSLPKTSKRGLYRDVLPEELAETMTHEYGHALDEAMNHVLRKTIKDDGIYDKIRRLAKEDAVDPEAWSYAASTPAEAVGEVFRMYVNGTGHFAEHTTLTAVEWRQTYPKIAEWVENNMLKLTPDDLYQVQA